MTALACPCGTPDVNGRHRCPWDPSTPEYDEPDNWDRDPCEEGHVLAAMERSYEAYVGRT